MVRTFSALSFHNAILLFVLIAIAFLFEINLCVCAGHEIFADKRTKHAESKITVEINWSLVLNCYFL